MSLPQKPWSKAVVDFLASLRLTIFLLIVLAVTSIFGTVIPQGDVPHEYLHQSTPAKIKLYQALDLFDMYHSWWFIGILCLFTANLIVCSVKRLPHVWRYVRRPETRLEDGTLSGLSNREEIPLKAAECDRESLKRLLVEHVGAVTVTETEDAVHLFAQKNAWSRLSVYVTHLSIVIIFIGAIIGSIWGYKGFVTIAEGESVATVQTRNGKVVDMGFAVRCDDFSVSYYPNGAPREFKSILTVLDAGGRPIASHTNVPIIVNDPLQYRGLTFYQSSYGKTGDHSFTITGDTGASGGTILVPTRGAKGLSDGSTIRVVESTPDVSRFIPGKRGAAAQVEVTTAAGEPSRSGIIYANHREDNALFAQQAGIPLLTYNGIVGEKDYTGLQVTKDPGVWVVWAGCILMTVGIYGAFLMSHRRVWIRIRPEEVLVAGHANKNQAAFEQSFARLVEAVREEVSEVKK